MWGYTPTLTDALVVSGYKSKTYFDISSTNVNSMCPTGVYNESTKKWDPEFNYRGSGFGLFNYASGNRSADVVLSFSKDDIIILDFKDSQGKGSTVNSVENCTKDETLSTSTGFLVFKADANSDAATTINVGRAGCIIAILVMEEDLTVATPTFTIGSYNYEQGGYAVTPSCATEGAALTYTIDGGAATACTSGTPFYAKNGKLNITASKAGWTSSSLAAVNQWTLNVAPSTTSPETLIPFQKSNDNGDKNIEHVYKSVTIAGGGSSAIAGIVSGDANALKLRTNMNSNTVTLNVNSGYVVTRVSIEAKSNNKGATIDLTSTTVDGGSNIMTSNTTFPISTADAVMYDTDGTAINAKNNIVFTFDNSNIDPDDSNKKNYQIQATIKVWYKTPVENAIADCKTYETSTAFATAIDAESFASAADVYAFHTQWQIAQADAASSNDITKVIFDAAVSSNTRWNGARTLSGEQYTGAPDNTYFDAWNTNASDASQKIYGLPAGTYTIKVATRSSATITDKSKYNVWVYDGSATVSLLGSHIGNAGGNLGNGWNWTYLSFTLAAEADVTIGFYAKPADNLWAGCDDWHLYKGTLETSVSATVGESGYATFVSPYSLDFTSTSIDAYAATVTESPENNVVTLTPLSQVPSNTPVLLYNAGGAIEEDIPVIGFAAAVGDNNLIAGTGNILATIDGDYKNLILNKVDGQIGFYFAADNTVATDRAYLHIASSLAPATESPAPMLLQFDNENLTGIRSIENGKLTMDNVIYDLQGRKVANPTKGLYIVNGKKTIIK